MLEKRQLILLSVIKKRGVEGQEVAAKLVGRSIATQKCCNFSRDDYSFPGNGVCIDHPTDRSDAVWLLPWSHSCLTHKCCWLKVICNQLES